MEVMVVHKAFEDTPRNVARVKIPSEIINIWNRERSIEEALNYAYRWTNNIDGSWSRNDISNNGDSNPNVTPTFFHPDGKGIRSTSRGDEMILFDHFNDRKPKTFKVEMETDAFIRFSSKEIA